jgi:hypothetical protein
MSDANTMFEEDADDQQQSKDPVRAHLRKLEAENKALREQAAQAEQARRELTFVKAGINPDDPKTKYFVKGYDGEITVESIRQAAEEAGFIQSREAAQAPERDAWNRVTRAAQVGENSEPTVDYADKIRQARTPDEVMQLLAQARAEAESL